MKVIKMSEEEINTLYFVIENVCRDLVSKNCKKVKEIENKSYLSKEEKASWIKDEEKVLMQNLNPLRNLQYLLEEKM